MRAAEVPAFLAELSALGVMVEPDGAGGLRVRVPRSAVSPADVARRVRSAKPALLAHFEGQNAEAKSSPEPAREYVNSSHAGGGLPAWEGSPDVYGVDALPRRHAPPASEAPEDRPHVSPVQVCGGCSRWTADAPGAEGGSCSAGWKAHNLPPCPELGPYPVTSRGSRCWAWGGKGWRKAVRA